MSEELLARMFYADCVRKASLDDRIRWYADLNCFRVPADFPMPLPADLAKDTDVYRNKQYQEAWRVLTDTLSEEEMSWGWWKHELKRTRAEWMTWWHEERTA